MGLTGLREETHYDNRKVLCFSERPANLAAMFDDLSRRFPVHPAIVEDDRQIDYRELHQLSGTVAANLLQAGIRHGDRVALLLGNCWEFLVSVVACLRIGAIIVPIGLRQKEPELQLFLNDSEAKVLIFESDLAGVIPPRRALHSLLHLFSVRGEVPGAQAFASLLDHTTPPEPVTLHEDDAAFIVYTSGTTGRPKGAILTHLGIIHSAMTFRECFGLGVHERSIVAVPLSHVTGLVSVSFTMMITGGCVVLMRRPYKTLDFLDIMSRERITVSVLVPTIYTLCSMQPNLQDYDLSAWRIGCFGGAPMPVATIESLAKQLPQLQLLNGYGATETTAPATLMPASRWRDHVDSVGVTVPCGRIKIVDDNGQESPPGTAGELLIAGPMVARGYWRRPDANASEFVDGFWRSGDIGTMDAEGFVRILDRKKDMISRGGFKIFSAEVENVLSGMPGVLECAVVGRPDPVLGERVHAIVVVGDTGQVEAQAIMNFCAQHLSDYKVPETVTVQASPLPRNANGKVRKQEFRTL